MTTPLAAYVLLFLAVGAGFIFVHLLAGKLIRPSRPDSEKDTIYECGEPTIGSAWIQFDLRFYVVALLFVIFDVEVAFFFPWAEVFGKANAIAKADPAHESAQVELAKAELLHQSPEQKLTPDTQKAAGQLAWLALIDIAVFFGVLLVGFAYLWRRGDLDWVRSTAAERAPPPSDEPVLLGEADQLVGAGRP